VQHVQLGTLGHRLMMSQSEMYLFRPSLADSLLRRQQQQQQLPQCPKGPDGQQTFFHPTSTVRSPLMTRVAALSTKNSTRQAAEQTASLQVQQHQMPLLLLVLLLLPIQSQQLRWQKQTQMGLVCYWRQLHMLNCCRTLVVQPCLNGPWQQSSSLSQNAPGQSRQSGACWLLSRTS